MKSANKECSFSIGALLASERKKRDIPVEKAAKETRMRPQRIRDMESDDLSHFTNPSYARMFIIAYAKYLGIPMKLIHDHLPDCGEAASEGYQYISTSTEELPSLRQDIVSKPAPRSSALYILVIATLMIVLTIVGGLGYYLVVNAPRLVAVANKPPAPEPTPILQPPPVIVKEITLNNVHPNGEVAVAFEDEVSMSTFPTPVPPITTIEKPALLPGIESASDDQAFLLGSSPDQKPPSIR